MSMRILLVEDDRMVEKAVRQGLAGAGFTVDWVADGNAAELAIATRVHDAVVLDLGLPRKDGMAVLKAIRHKGVTTPILIATARDAVADRIAGLNAGADDYVLKPFDLDELIARLRSVLRRQSNAPPLLTCGSLALDPVQRVLTLCNENVDLSSREFAIMELLMARPGAVVSREKLEESVYGWGQEIASNAIEVHLHNLRKKLGSKAIRNVRGVGYRMASEP